MRDKIHAGSALPGACRNGAAGGCGCSIRTAGFGRRRLRAVTYAALGLGRLCVLGVLVIIFTA
jgi:hypothetical protein